MNYECYGQNKIIKTGNTYSWILMGLLTELMTEKKTRMHFGSLIKSFESMIDITKKVPSLVSLIASMEFNSSFGVKNRIYWIFE